MAEKTVVREDVIRVSYDVEQSPFGKVNSEIAQAAAGASGVASAARGAGSSLANAGKQAGALSAAGNSGFSGIRKQAAGASESVGSLSAGLSTAAGGLKSLPAAAVQKVGTALTSAAKDGAQKLYSGLQKAGQAIRNLPSAAVNKLASGLKKAGTAALDASKGLLSIGGKAVLGGIAAAAAGITALSVKAVNAFADMEQNVGGAETVFQDLGSNIHEITANIQTLDPATGQLADTTKSLADISADAYKTMGISQSDYLASANKMASLFQGSGLTQQRSLDLTTQAMQRAADVASIMGIDQESAMEAVTGAAKGNYTMMDNLGVAMNATTLEAYRVSKGLDTAFSKMDNAQKAELAMQYFFERTEQYAGNFEKEATETVSGSFGLLKAAASSLVAGLGDSDADIGHLTGNVIDAFRAVAKNVKPVLEAVADSVPEVLRTVGGELAKEAPGLISGFISNVRTGIPQIVQTAQTAIPQVASGIMSVAGQLFEAGSELMGQLMAGITPRIPELIPQGISAALNFIQGAVSGLPSVLSVGGQIISAVGQGILNALPVIAEQGSTIIHDLTSTVVGALPDLGTALLNGLVEIIQNLPSLLVGAVKGLGGGIVDGIKSWFTGGDEEAASAGADTASRIAAGLTSNSGAVTDAARDISLKATEAFALDTGAVETQAAGLAVNFQGAMTAQLPAYSGAMETAAVEAGAAFSSGLDSQSGNMAETARNAAQAAQAEFTGIDLYEPGVMAGQGFANGLASQKGAILAQARDIANSVSGTVNKSLKINSPSKVAVDSAEFYDTGLINGLENLKGKVGKTAAGVADEIRIKSAAGLKGADGQAVAAVSGTAAPIHDSVKLARKNIEAASGSLEPVRGFAKSPRGDTEPARGTAAGGGASTVTNSRSYSSSVNTFSPSFVLNMNGASANQATERKVRRWIRDGINDTFDQLSRQTAYAAG